MQALNTVAYQNNPQFLPVAQQYGFAPIPKFTKQSIADRANIYLQIAADIWDPDAIKVIAGGWEEETEKEFFKNEKAREFTVEYYERSWPDALKYGFLSSNIGGTGKFLKNVQEGDIVYCHIAGAGFVGIGECTAAAVPMKQFTVVVDGANVPISDAAWVEPSYKAKLDANNEIFIRVDWKSFVDNQDDGYWEKGIALRRLAGATEILDQVLAFFELLLLEAENGSDLLQAQRQAVVSSSDQCALP